MFFSPEVLCQHLVALMRGQRVCRFDTCMHTRPDTLFSAWKVLDLHITILHLVPSQNISLRKSQNSWELVKYIIVWHMTSQYILKIVYLKKINMCEWFRIVSNVLLILFENLCHISIIHTHWRASEAENLLTQTSNVRNRYNSLLWLKGEMAKGFFAFFLQEFWPALCDIICPNVWWGFKPFIVGSYFLFSVRESALQNFVVSTDSVFRDFAILCFVPTIPYITCSVYLYTFSSQLGVWWEIPISSAAIRVCHVTSNNSVSYSQ